MFIKIGVLRNFPIFRGKYLCWSLFLIKLQAFRLAILFKRDSNTCVFLLILLNVLQRLFLPLIATSVLWTIKILSFNRALENLRALDDFNFANFLSDRVMGCSTMLYFLKVLLINSFSI